MGLMGSVLSHTNYHIAKVQAKLALMAIGLEDADRHLRRDPRWMQATIALCQSMIDTIAAGAGLGLPEVPSEGSWRLIANSTRALAACALKLSEAWQEQPLPLKIAIHLGRADESGSPMPSSVRRTGALMHAAHGGQILLTDSAHRRLYDSGDTALVADLGELRVRGWSRAGRIYQIGDGAFGPLLTARASGVGNELPIRSGSVVGREADIKQLSERLSAGGLVTLAGAGGSGKTQLAIHAAIAAGPHFPDGVWFVDLSVLVDEELVDRTIVRTLCPKSAVATLDALVAELSGRRLLVVVDNCEHLIVSVSAAVGWLRVRLPRVAFLATSRQPLGIPGELVVPVSGLATPEGSPASLAELISVDSGRLIADRVRRVRPEFSRQPAELAAMGAICRYVGGLPLAIELAAAQMAGLRASQIAESFRSLIWAETGDMAVPRQQTMRALIDWSYRLLTMAERRLFRHVSVFVGSWTARAANDFCRHAGDSAGETGTLLTSLVDKSLLTLDGRTGKLSMLPILREFALLRLRESDEEPRYRRAHCALCVELASDIAARETRPADSSRARGEHVEQADFRAALGWAIGQGNDSQAALSITGQLGVLWYQQGFAIETRQWLHRALSASADRGPTPARLKALTAAIGVAGFEGDKAALSRLCSELETDARTLGDESFLATALQERGKLAQYHEGDMHAARRYFDEALALYRRQPSSKREANQVGLSLGLLATSMGDYDAAVGYLGPTLETARSTGDTETIGYAQSCLAITLYDAGRFEEAEDLYAEGIQTAEAQGWRTLELNHRMLSSRLVLDRGCIARAQKGYGRAIALAREIKDRHRERLSQMGLARALAEGGDWRAGAEQLMRCSTPFDLPPDDQMLVDMLLAIATVFFAAGQFKESGHALGATQSIRNGIPWAIPPAERGRWDLLRSRLEAQLGTEPVEACLNAGASVDWEAFRQRLIEGLPPTAAED